ncbi:MAG: hypothetical protein KGR48_13010 [Alphaproteobacteria bacterium]|nr:hypothetical protein [Alphaproteobacteria bacterium]MDE2013939.1 hypothetical protein [Alphaproteobacteria bacterium]MDE2073756.1 hypothetical protein [Alphaproteobacteria bacterium]
MTCEFDVTALRLKAQREATLLFSLSAFLIGLALGTFTTHFTLPGRYAFGISMLGLFAGSGLLVVSGFRQLLHQREIRLARHGLSD